MSAGVIPRDRALPDVTVDVPFSDLGSMTADVAEELEAVWKRLTATSSFVGGSAVERFEHQWSQYCGTAQAVGVANGTDAIELILRGLGIGPGDEVIVPANTFIATAEGVLMAGATPRFVDVDPESLLITPETIDPAVNERTAAIIPVHLYGNTPHMDDLGRLARAKRLALIEDAAQAHGSTWGGKKAGSFGIAASFSFYPGKNLGAFGDAGAVVTNDSGLADRVRSMSNHGRSPASGHVHSLVGRNSRLDALQAAVLSAKLPMLGFWNGARRAIMRTYTRLLGSAAVQMVQQGTGSAYHLNVVRVPDRDRVREALRRMGIETGIHYPIPCHLQMPYREFASDPLPAAETAAKQILSLPLFPHMTHAHIERVCDSLNEILQPERTHVG